MSNTGSLFAIGITLTGLGFGIEYGVGTGFTMAGLGFCVAAFWKACLGVSDE
jgi:hypothetical protein